MARILVSYYKLQETTIKTRMYYFEAFAKELCRIGNDVFIINTAYFNEYRSNVVVDASLDKLLLDAAIKFDPELIISFNHRIPKSILQTIDVPIVVWDGDSPFYFCDIDYMKENRSRYQIFSISKQWYEDYLSLGFSKEAYHYMPNATSIEPLSIPQTMNISYLGARIWADKTIPNGLRNHEFLPMCKQLVEESLLTGNTNSEYYLSKYFQQEKLLNGWNETKMYPLLDWRWMVLANVLDLGLTISGHYSRWEDTYELMPQLLSMYNPQRVWTLEENNSFYNKSKISLSPIHPQANGIAFPWRAFDVMASNACLVIAESSDLKTLLADSKVDIPFFSSPYEARTQCINLLEDENRRREVVAASQEWVNNNARWIHRFRKAESILAMPLIHEGEEGSLFDVVFDDKDVSSLIFHSNEVQVQKSVSVIKEKKTEQKNSRSEQLKKLFYMLVSHYWEKVQPINVILKSIGFGIALMLIGLINLIFVEYDIASAECFTFFFKIVGFIFYFGGLLFVIYEHIILLGKTVIAIKKLIRKKDTKNETTD